MAHEIDNESNHGRGRWHGIVCSNRVTSTLAVAQATYDRKIARRDYRLGRQYVRELAKYGGLGYALAHHLYDARASVGINPAHLSYVIGESDELLLMASRY